MTRVDPLLVSSVCRRQTFYVTSPSTDTCRIATTTTTTKSADADDDADDDDDDVPSTFLLASVAFRQ